MKKILYFLVALIAAVAAAFFANNWLQGFDTPGYVLMGIGHWSLETTLSVFAVTQIMGFFVLYFVFRSLGYLIRLPGRLKHRSRAVKFNRSQEALITGLVDSAEGNWEKAENILIKHASHSGAPLLHYLTAAKAAQSRGAFDKRDEYLKKANDQAPDSSIAIGLTQAELHLSGNEFDQALETLTKLHSIEPGHASVLKLLHQTYQTMGDWESMRKLLPSLHTHKVLMETEIKLLETEAFSKLLKQSAETGDVGAIQKRWAEVPNYIRKIPGISAIYFAAMINAGAGADIEDELALALSIDWDNTLLVLFGSVPSNDVSKQLAMAERWLSLHENDPVLLTILGKLSAKSAGNEKAREYLAQSIAVEPTVLAYQLLGDLLFAEGDQAEASRCYKQGLELASSEIISRINTISY
ncbi:MAG: heme biosynthesis HemY N-terminal domain-containing protein [Methylovulum miyakonense]|uniref:heme biosynthesis HemY N-terminal domain-containing protein n=1 Tax=Methylovulum miyakonense TaxID=645578 RepID=UPI0003808A19|nr:heme biosynthesis HemY N-terminal domain-containing protein [Methylovulum miyakonense]